MKKSTLMTTGCVVVSSIRLFACAELMSDGTKCERPPLPGSVYCRQHIGGHVRVVVPRMDPVVVVGRETASRMVAGMATNDMEDVKKAIEIDSFMGIKFGIPLANVGGTSVKGYKDRREIRLKRPFRGFKQATVICDSDSELTKTVRAEFVLPVKKSEEDALTEYDAVKGIVERKYSIKVSPCVYSNCYSVEDRSNRLSGMGLCSAEYDPNEVRAGYYNDKNVAIRMSCKKCKIENKSLKGPGQKAELLSHKIIIEVTSKKKYQVESKKSRKDYDGIDAL